MKKYLEFTVNKKPDKIKKHQIFRKLTERKFFKILLLKKDAQLVINDNREQGLNFENFSWGLCYRSLSQNDLNCFKNRLKTCRFAGWQFFFYKEILRGSYSPWRRLLSYTYLRNSRRLWWFSRVDEGVYFQENDLVYQLHGQSI